MEFVGKDNGGKIVMQCNRGGSTLDEILKKGSKMTCGC